MPHKTRVIKKQLIDNKSKIIIKLFIVAVSSILLVYLDARTTYINTSKGYINNAIYPLKIIAQSPSSIGKTIKTWSVDKSELIETIKQMQEKQRTLEFEVQRNTTLLAENQRLRLLLRSSSRLQYPTIIAEIISVNSNPYRHIVELDRGTSDSVRIHQSIMDTFGIVGQIIETNLNSSKALLISDPQHLFSIQVNRNGIRGLAQGTGNPSVLDILNIAIDEDVQVGDLLVSSGLDQRYPQGYPVAIITSIEHDPTNHFAKISAKPTAELSKIREVLIVKSQDQESNTVQSNNEENEEE